MTDSGQPVAGPGGVKASAFGDPISDLLAADPPPAIRTATSELLDEALAAPRVHRTRQEVWIEEPGRLGPGGHWEEVVT
jgi:hypothetical protein